MKVVVIGANGQLGTDICEAFLENSDEIIELTLDQIEVSDFNLVSSVLKKTNPELVINTAAMHNLEECEKNPVRSFEVNGLGAMNLALVCQEIDSTLMHMSTDYVFDGKKNKPYLESDQPSPLNVYANTKLSGEYFIQSVSDKYFICRVSGLYGKNPCLAKGYNFVDLMLKLSKEREEVRVVDDEILTPTFTEDISAQIVKLVHSNPSYGLYHITAEGCCSWYEFAKEIFSLTETKIVLNRASPGEFASTINRPKYSVLENGFLKKQKLNLMPQWQEGLKRYLKKKYN